MNIKKIMILLILLMAITTTIILFKQINPEVFKSAIDSIIKIAV